MSKNVKPVAGAATYSVGLSTSLKGLKFSVTMLVNDENGRQFDEIQTFKTFEAASIAADKWQTKENNSVTNS